jgi:tRNA(Ile)-lysidine synthase
LADAWPPEQWKGVHVMVATSGGGDSMALLRAALAVKRQVGGMGKIFAGHVNHQLRGEAPDDVAWLRGECERLGAPLLVESCDTRSLAAEQGDGLESAARDLRYQLLIKMAELAGARYLAVAHTSDDQVETMLFRLLRGTGLRGLAGMPRSRTLSPSVTLVRPLLACSRSELRGYLASVKQTFREDATNGNAGFARNRIRQQLLPHLREHFNSEVDAALLRAADAAGEAQAVIEKLAANVLVQCHPLRKERRLELITLPLIGQPEYVIREAMRLAWRDAGFPEQGMTSGWWRKLAQFAQSREPQASLNLPGNVLAHRLDSRSLALIATPLA